MSGHSNGSESNLDLSTLQRSRGVIAGPFVALAVGACVESPYRLSKVKGDGMSVVVTHARNEAEARPLAEDHSFACYERAS